MGYTISIVVAMYNIEDYIQYCLDSCAKQINAQENDYEVIIIDDGSSDNSLGIAERFVSEKKNFSVFSQPNAGLSSARNMGLEVARGEYVWFVDGDDAIDPYAVFTLITKIREDPADAYICNFRTFDKTGILSTSSFEPLPKMSGKALHDKYMRLLPMMAWLTVYKTTKLKEHNLSFLPGIVHEDKEFSVRAHHLMESVSFISEPLYNYRSNREGSIMNLTKTDNTKSLVSEIRIIESFLQFFCEEDTPFTRKLLGLCATYFFIRRYCPAFIENDVTKRLVSENRLNLYRLMWRSKQWKQLLLLVFIIVMPSAIISSYLTKLGLRLGML